MIIGKRHFILAALVLALGAAVYLNWQFAPTESVVEPDETVNAGDARYVSAELSATDAALYDGEVVETGKKQNWYDSARAERDETRQEAMDTLDDIISDPSLSDSQKADAANKKAAIAGYIERESAIETLLKAKGYKECVVVMSDAQVNVVVPAKDGGMTSADAAVIKDIVIGQISVSPSCIKIIEAN